MDKERRKGPLRLIDDGSEAGLWQYKASPTGTLRQITDPADRSGTRRMLRPIDEEVLVRQSLSPRNQGQGSQSA